MPRKVQDIRPAEKRSIREVDSTSRSSKTAKRKRASHEGEIEVIEQEGVEDVPVRIENRIDNSLKVKDMKTPDLDRSILVERSVLPQRRMPITPPMAEYEIKRKNIWKWPIITLLAILFVGVIGYFASAYYSQATFTIVPKIIPVSINNTYVAQPTGNDLVYQVISLKRSATTTVSATNGSVTNTKATGKVTFYNTFSNQSIRLIAGTRLTAQNGLMYRLSSSIVIPGYTKPGSTIIPGKIVANIAADQAGQQYNITAEELGDFKIVAYSGSAKYSTVYAKAVSSIAGGFAGVKKVISPNAMASTTAKLKADITEALIGEVKTSIPDGYIMYDKSYTTTFTSPVIGGSDPKVATVSMEGTINAISLPKSKLIEAFAGSETIGLFGPFSYTSPGLEDLNVTITNLKDFSTNKKIALVLKVKGDIKIIGTIPVEELKNKLAGISLPESQDVFKSYGSVIESGSGELAPPWANIPTDLKKINVIVEE